MSNQGNIKQAILMVGVGGQGIVLASDILGETALAVGLDVKKTDTLGMAQRGGSVTSHLRIAKKVWAPLISPGEADIVLAFEKLEAARWINYIKPDGLVIINDLAIPPLSISLGVQAYPDDHEIIDSYKQRTDKIHLIDGSSQVAALGEIRALNIYMLGFLSVFLLMDVSIEKWKYCISGQLPPKIRDVNIRAFEKGREIASHVNL